MNPPRVQAEDYIDFLIATPKVCSATEAARVQPPKPRPPAHDAFTRSWLDGVLPVAVMVNTPQ